ncbi:MAG: hypothetical protein AMXMBFR44_4830 [Candidatus Campbellbacteria bacterium]
MPSVYSHYNRNVSSVWYLIVVFMCVVGIVTWRAYVAVQEIDLNNRDMVSRMEDLMTQNQPR